jgi:hypothetical protein
MDFRLRAERRGGLVAIILRAQTLEAGAWRDVAVDTTCRSALHAKKGELAEVRLAPLTPEAAKLGDAFLAFCAPQDLFSPLADILNVALIQTQPAFQLQALRSVGDAAAYDGFATEFSRPGMRFSETSAGGDTILADAGDGRVTIDWKPTPSALQMRVGSAGTGGETDLSGTEHFAFRLTLAARTGVLEEAHTLYDDLSPVASAPGLPADRAPRFAITRTVTVARVG